MVLNELRMRYVELMKLVAQQATAKGPNPGIAGSIGTTI